MVHPRADGAGRSGLGFAGCSGAAEERVVRRPPDGNPSRNMYPPKNGTKWHWEAAFSNGFGASSACMKGIQSVVSWWLTTSYDAYAALACSAISGHDVPYPAGWR
jgi:hypothetical protein